MRSSRSAAGAFLIACLEQALAGARPAPTVIAGRAIALVRDPITRPVTYDRWLYHGAPLLLLGQNKRRETLCAPGEKQTERHQGAPRRPPHRSAPR